MREAFTVCTAVARAFGFVLGRRCVIRGHEEINESRETRRLDTRYPKTTTNSLLQPLGCQLEFMQNVERLLGLAIDFFLTELGERVAPYLYLCWDTADNSHLTQLAISSICVEGLLRVAAEAMGADAAAGRSGRPHGVSGVAGRRGTLGSRHSFSIDSTV